MSQPQTGLTTTKPTLKQLLQQDGYKNRFNAMLGNRAPQFMASIINVASAYNFRDVEPTSILSAAAVAATLDLPIDKNLGFAWIIPYGNLAQFQIGWKGVVQLALRSGQYRGMNAFFVNKEALGEFNEIGDRVILWEFLDETKPPVGYGFAWKLVNGFSKLIYWPVEKVAAHAEKYSQNHKAHISKGYPKGRECKWCSDFDPMALKTVVKNGLSKWGILSVEMRQAIQLDQSAAIDIDARPVYPDNEGIEEQSESAPKGPDALAASLKAQREQAPADAQAVAEPVRRESGDEEPPKPPSAAYGLFIDAFEACKQTTSLKTASEAIYAHLGDLEADQASDAQLEAAAKALNAATKKAKK